MRVLIAAAVAVALSASPAVAADRSPRDLAGVWWTAAYQPRLVPIDGQPIPFSAEGRSRYKESMDRLQRDATVDQAAHLCLPEGMPRAMTSAYPFQIILSPGAAIFAHEVNRAYRLVRFTDKHADADLWDPSYMGEGIASWSRDTLMIDSTNFKVGGIHLDSTGLPASDKLHLTERIRLIKDGTELEELITIDDPITFTRPWTVRMTFRRRDDIKLRTDWVCGEPHRDVAAIMGTVAK